MTGISAFFDTKCPQILWVKYPYQINVVTFVSGAWNKQDPTTSWKGQMGFALYKNDDILLNQIPLNFVDKGYIYTSKVRDYLLTNPKNTALILEKVVNLIVGCSGCTQEVLNVYMAAVQHFEKLNDRKL